MNNQIVPRDAYSVFVRPMEHCVIADVYRVGDRGGHRLLHQAYKSEATALAAIRRRLRPGYLVLHREHWLGRIETVGIC